jgi:hypothetical protein
VSWWLLCLSRDDFKGSSAGVPVRSSYVHQFEGLADGGSEDAQQQMWRRPVGLGFHSAGVTLQCPGWWHSGGDGHTGPEVTEKTRSAGLTSRCRPGGHGVCGRTPFEGALILFREARRGGGTGVGGTVSQNDTGLPA